MYKAYFSKFTKFEIYQKLLDKHAKTSKTEPNLIKDYQ